MDRPGSDYRNFELREPRPELCRNECVREARCRAFTYVKPGVRGEFAVCWLKDQVPDATPNENCVSGVVARWSSPDPTPVPREALSMEPGIDRPGKDYLSFELPEPSPELCRDACADDTRCRAYTYVRPGVRGEAAVCWLKDVISDPVPNENCVSGVKRRRDNAAR